jgi:hypothetical protein
MRVVRRTWPEATAIAAARIHHHVGWPGVVGAALVVASVAVYLYDRHKTETNATPTQLEAASRAELTDATLASAPREAVKLVPERDVSLILTRMERSAFSQGLSWSRADYRLVPSNADLPASLEVSTSLRGPYLSIRKLLAAMLNDTPALTLRSLNITRPGPDTPDVEAKITAAVLLDQPRRSAVPSAEKVSER